MPRRAVGGAVLALAALALAALGLAPGITAPAAHATDYTAAQDTQRTSWDPAETTMGPAAVKGYTQLFATAVKGQVYAQPLVIDSISTVIVATETDNVYGLNAATGAILWHTSLGTPYPITNCHDLTPDIGITGTPVYDPASGMVYLVAQTGGTNPNWAVWGINPVTGAATQIQKIAGHPANDSHRTLAPAQEMARPGLLLMNGWVYTAFGSHCDHKPYVGYVAGVNVTTKKLALWTDENGVANNQAGIWQGGGGVMSDGPGRIFVTSGNGVSPAYGPGTKVPGTLAESAIHLSVNPTTGALTPVDFFSPNNAPALDAADHDWGSGGSMGLPFGVSGGKKAYPHLMAQIGKDGRIFILNRDNLGGRSTTNSGALYVSPVYSGLWGHPAVFANTTTLTAKNAAAARDYMYFVGKNDVLRVFKFGVTSSGLPTLSDVANSKLVFGYTSGSPSITSNGTDATTAVLWVVYSASSAGASGTLEAYNVSSTALAGCSAAKPCGINPIFSTPIGVAAKFSSIATSAGRAYVGTRGTSTGYVYGFGPKPAAAPLAASATTLSSTPVGTTAIKTVSVTATHATTVNAVSATTGATNAAAPGTQFSVTGETVIRNGTTTAVPVTLPVALAAGDRLDATVSFTPAAPGSTTGTLTLTTKSPAQPIVRVPLFGTGTQTALFAQNAAAFPLAPDQGVTDVPVGTAALNSIVVSNFGTHPYTITSVTPPAGGFSFETGGAIPAAGQTLAPGQSIEVAVAYDPILAGRGAGSFAITGTSGGITTTTKVALSGTAIPAVSQVAAPAVNFGTIPVGKKTTLYVHIVNTGNTQAEIAGTSPLPAPFSAQATPQAGLPFNPSYDLLIPVSFTPKKAGKFTALYTMKWTDMEGTHTLKVLLTGTAR